MKIGYLGFLVGMYWDLGRVASYTCNIVSEGGLQACRGKKRSAMFQGQLNTTTASYEAACSPDNFDTFFNKIGQIEKVFPRPPPKKKKKKLIWRVRGLTITVCAIV